MNATTRHNLTQAATISGFAVMEKSASASQEQQEILDAVWPGEDVLSKTAALARVLAAGVLVEEADG